MNSISNFIQKLRVAIPAWVWTLLKGLVSAGLVVWLALGFDWSKVYSTLAGISWLVVAAWFGIWLLSYCLMALRMRMLFSAQNIKIGFLYALSILFIGAFAGNFLPSSVGGDTAKFVLLARAGYSKSVSGAALILDRFFNILASALFLLFALLVPGLINIDFQTAHILPYWMAGITLFGGGLIVMVVAVGRSLIKSPPSPSTDNSFKSRLHRMIYRIAVIASQWINRPWVLAGAMGLSFIAILLIFIDGWILARGMNIVMPLVSWFAIQACLSALVLLPISFNGLGLQEVSLVYLTALVGIPEEKSLALALLLRVFTVLFSLLGAFWVIAEKRKVSKSGSYESKG